jgi:hypothetical protein
MQGFRTDENGDVWKRRPMGFLCDDEDWESLRQHHWTAQKIENVWYMSRPTTGHSDGHASLIYMHQEIMRPVPGMTVHHINGNGLDNRRCNLEVVSQAQHAARHREGRRRGALLRWERVRRRALCELHT